MAPREVPQTLSQALLGPIGGSLGTALGRAVLAHHPARPPLRHPEPRLEPLNGHPAAVRGHHSPSASSSGHRLVQLRLRQQLLQPGVLRLQLLEPPRVAGAHARIGPPPPVPGRLGDLQMPEHLGQVAARSEHPLALADLANRLLRTMASPLHRGHPPILGESDPQHADSNQGPTSRLPQSVLEELACNAKFTGVVYDRRGRPIWRAHSVRRATEAQRQLLIARDGGCFVCGAHPDICDAHHVRPVSEGGPTSIDNMVLACWRCHHKIHYFGWQVHGPPGRRTLHPPEAATYGPAHAPERPSLFRSGTSTAPDQAQLIESAADQMPDPLGLGTAEAARAPDHPEANGSRPGGARQMQSGDRSAKPGPAAARAVLARSRVRRAGTANASAADRGPP